MSLINNHYFITLFNVADGMGLDLDNLADDIGIKKASLGDQSLWVNDDCLAQLFNILWRESADECMGLTVEPCALGTAALILDYMLFADTLGELYRRGEKVCSLIPNINGIKYQVDKENVLIHICDGYVSEKDPQRFLIEFVAVVCHRFACWATDYYIPLNNIYFAYAQPDHLFCYDGLFQCAVNFDQKVTGFSFDKKLLSKPIVRCKKELANWLLHSPADLLSMPGQDGTISKQIKVFLASQLRTNRRLPSFAVTCKKLHITTHRAQRRLSEEGSSYQKIKDAVRMGVIKEMLDNPDYSVSQVSECSGFTEVASFARAVKKSTGMTPGQYRKNLN
jgi:AraC-like DNA-binding protein